jgi:RimJ/RimL family protein N-acetyltransferase
VFGNGVAASTLALRWSDTRCVTARSGEPFDVGLVADFVDTAASVTLAGRREGQVVEVRCATAHEVADLVVAVAAGGLDDAASRAGMRGWVDADPSTVAWRTMANLAQHAEDLNDSVDADDIWNVAFVVFVDGRPVGRQSMYRSEHHEPGHVKSGSWVLNTVRGTGVGLAARRCMLAIATEAGVRVAHTEWRVGNAASETVSRRCGYTLGDVTAPTSGGAVDAVQTASVVLRDSSGVTSHARAVAEGVRVDSCPRLWLQANIATV